VEIQHRCSEKGCPFLPKPGENYCRSHSAMFDHSDEEVGDVELVFLKDQLYGQNHGRRNGDSMDSREALDGVFGKTLSAVKPWLDEWLQKRERKETQLAVVAAGYSLRRKTRAAAGLCPSCGRRNDRPNPRICSKCTQRDRARRQLLKAAGLCSHCGKDPAVKGHVHCLTCREKQKLRDELLQIERAKRRAMKKRAPKRKGRYCSAIIAQARRFKVRKNAGICVFCGRPKNCPTVACDDCRKKKNTYYERRYKMRKEAGICFTCGANPARDDRVTCCECEQQRVRRSKKIRQKRKRSKLCTACGRPNDHPGALRCRRCSKQIDERLIRLRARKRLAAV
jgi:hypothetical protein